MQEGPLRRSEPSSLLRKVAPGKDPHPSPSPARGMETEKLSLDWLNQRRRIDKLLGQRKLKPFRNSAFRRELASGHRIAARRLYEIKSADILQPGPAALTDGVDQLHRIVADWAKDHA